DRFISGTLSSCEDTVTVVVEELAALNDHTMDWLHSVADAEKAGTLDVEEMKADAELVAQKMLAFQTSAEELVKFGGPQATYAALAADSVRSVATAMLIWAVGGIDVEAGTYDMSLLEGM